MKVVNGGFNPELILLIVDFLPGLVAPRVGVVTHRTGLTIACVFLFTIVIILLLVLSFKVS